MASLHDKLLGKYPEKGLQPSNSWIPKRQFQLDPTERLRQNLLDEIAGREAKEEEERVLETLMQDAIEEIFASVEDWFERELGQGPALENRLYNFKASWENQFNRHGVILVWAIGEMTEEMNFVNKAGFIRIDLVKMKMDEIEKRKKH